MPTCRDCIFDEFDPESPDFKNCDAPGHIPNETFEQYDDTKLPEHCGFFTEREAS